MKADPDEHVAAALAWGFLAATNWDQAGLVAAAGLTLGRRHRWAQSVARQVLATYRTAPVEAPSGLASFIAGETGLGEAMSRARLRGSPVRVRQIVTVPGRMGPPRWPVPEVDDLPALARLLEVPLEQLPWMADVKGLQRRTAAGPLHLYRYRWVTRSGALPRLLEVPTPLLRATLRRLLEKILLWVPVHPAAHGFVRSRSVRTHSAEHVGADVLVCLDLRSFFTAVTMARVDGVFRAMAYPEAVARTLAGLTTHRTPTWVLARMPSGGGSADRHRLHARLRTPHLPQGAPTSPGLANLAAFVLDRRLTGLATTLGAHYTRYADDLAFSGSASLSPSRLVRVVTAIATGEGFTVNTAKTRVRRSTQRQQLTGVVVNARPGIAREERDRLRAVLHDVRLHGVESANRAGHLAFRAHLDGRVGWVESVNPAQGGRLRRQFDAIDWSDGR